jgi:hypothetical protein
MALFEQKAPGIMAGLMKDLGITLYQSCGILGSFGWECGGFEQLHQGGGGAAIGWPQWDGVRKAAYLAWCDKNRLSWTSDEANYRYFVQEIRTTERASLVALKATSTVEDACDVFEKTFERAGVPALEGRRTYGRRALAAYMAAPQPVTPLIEIGDPVVPNAPRPTLPPATKPAPAGTHPTTHPTSAPIGVIAGGAGALAAQSTGWSTWTVILVGVAAFVLGFLAVELIAKGRTKP